MGKEAGTPPLETSGAKRPAPTQTFYLSVQGLRGVAALSVFLLHLYDMSDHAGFFPGAPAPLVVAWSTLGQGVGLFFIISGFVIPASLVRHGDLRRFFFDRLLRIMPLFVILHLLVFTIGPFIGYKWMRDIGVAHYAELFLTNLTFTALPLGLPLAQQNAWTLTFEWAFYISVACAWLATNRSSSRMPAMVATVLFAAIVCWFFPICLFFVIGMGFAHFRPKVRIHPVLEAVAIPLCLGTYYYLGQYVSTYYAALPGAIFFLAVLQERSLTARVLCARPLQFLGMISYSLYLVHPFAVFPFQMIGHLLLARGFAPAQIFLPYVACAAVATFALSIPSYYLIEVRLRSAIVGWMKGRRIRAQERLA